MKRTSRSNVRSKLTMWALGTMLPNPTTLQPYLQSAKQSIIAAVLCGLFLATAALTALLAFYHYMVTQGIEPINALLLVSGITAILGGIAYLTSRRNADYTANVTEKFGLFSDDRVPPLSSALNAIAEGFFQGFSEPTDTKLSKTRELLNETLEKLEKVEAALSAETSSTDNLVEKQTNHTGGRFTSSHKELPTKEVTHVSVTTH